MIFFVTSLKAHTFFVVERGDLIGMFVGFLVYWQMSTFNC